MKLGITGTRDGFSVAQKEQALHLVKGNVEFVSEFHSGDCVGVDDQMLDLLLGWNYQKDIYLYPALVNEKWRAHGFSKLGNHKALITVFKPLPPKVRNGYIAENCDELWAFPGSGGGTWDCIRKAQALGRSGLIVYQSGRTVDL